MSTNYTRCITKNVTDNGTYKKLQLKYYYDWYWEDYQRLSNGLYSSQFRSYKTWKYNRKKQYKE